ncbi:hypothetical protein PYCCODRAFT_1332205, partial [Trametes coccinea BRFM310]
TGHRLSRIPLVIGMPVVVSQNYDVHGGIVNGSIGTLTAIRFIQDSSMPNRRYLKSCVVHINDVSAPSMPGLDVGDYPVLEDTVSL